MTFQHLSALRSYPNPIPNEVYHLLGYHTPGDGGGGDFYWDSAATGGDNTGMVFQSTQSSTGRWKRLYSDPVNARWFGAKGDGTTDDTLALQAALNFVANSGKSRTLLIPDGVYNITSQLFVLDQTHITGSVNYKTIIKKTTNTAANYPSPRPEDMYNVDAIMCIVQPSYGLYAYQNNIENIRLKGEAPNKNQYGLYYPRTNHTRLTKVEVENCINGFYTKDSWQCEHIALVAARCDHGFVFAPTTPQSGAGTSCTFVRCWASGCRLSGYNIRNLYYTSFSDCACDKLNNNSYSTDGIIPTAYSFEGCDGITMMSCGVESGICQAIHLKDTKAFSLTGSFHSFPPISTVFNDTTAGLLKFENSVAAFSGYLLYTESLQGTNMSNIYATTSQVSFTNSIYSLPYGKTFVDNDSTIIDLGGTSSHLYNPTTTPVVNMTAAVISKHIRVPDLGAKGLAYISMPAKAVIRGIRFSALNTTNTSSFKIMVGYNATDKNSYYGVVNWPFPTDQYVQLAVSPGKSRKPATLSNGEGWVLFVSTDPSQLAAGAGLVFEVEYVIEN
ncbi:hypothetical protein HF329_14755 [Chitinophaga oryzae]|uniref:Rhamnogalacturonase A/B/Epimerase-like pectate lyase domain-containing protein n=1 Tax=Chitinophaga oryzae TaxID=2725414 RepID=A0AAE6ZIT5_9BACT|nr:glycosyl hydrolase family 28-related protein [Chitinophaga oryzae]QJB32514.1 hypothetical protein HF329_14755 [Chitinophaga oryzae]